MLVLILNYLCTMIWFAMYLREDYTMYGITAMAWLIASVIHTVRYLKTKKSEKED